MTRVRFILLAGLLVLASLAVLAGCRSAHTTSAILYIDEQNYDKAVQVIHEGFEYRDDEPDAFYYLGEAYSHLAEEAVDDDDFPEALARLMGERVRQYDYEDLEEEAARLIGVEILDLPLSRVPRFVDAPLAPRAWGALCLHRSLANSISGPGPITTPTDSDSPRNAW